MAGKHLSERSFLWIQKVHILHVHGHAWTFTNCSSCTAHVDSHVGLYIFLKVQGLVYRLAHVHTPVGQGHAYVFCMCLMCNDMLETTVVRCINFGNEHSFSINDHTEQISAAVASVLQ